MVYTGNSRDDILDLFYCQRPDTLYFMTMKTDCSTGLYGYLCCACLPARCNEGRSSENGALRDTQLKLLAAIERDRMDRLRKKIRKDNFGGSVSEPILNHKMNQYRYYVKLYENFIASANMSVFTPMII